MITLEQFENTPYFWLNDLEDIIIGHTASMVVEVMINRDTIIFDEMLYAEENGDVVLRNLPDLLEPYFDSNISITVDINQIGSEIYYSRRSLPGIDASQFVNSLPLLLNVSDTIYSSLQDLIGIPFLLPKNSSIDNVKVDCYGKDDNGYLYVESDVEVLYNPTGFPKADTLVLPLKGLFATKMMRQFVPYGIAISIDGKQVAQICIVNDDNQITLEYLNNFNQLTRISIPGTLQYKPDYNRIIGRVFGQSLTIQAKEEVKHTFLCGPVGDDVILQLMDAASSTNCKYIDKQGKAYDIVMDNPEIEYSIGNTDFVTPKFSFTRSKQSAALIEKT